MNYIVDTSYWIEYFKNNEAVVRELDSISLDEDIIGLSPVLGELLQGARSKKELKMIVGMWEQLDHVDESDLFSKAGKYSFQNGLINRGIGIIDATLIFTAIHEKAIILTFDKKIIKFMDELQKK